MKALLIIGFSSFLFAFSEPNMSLQNDFRSGGGPSTVSISVVTPAKANELFRKFAQDKSIPFKYPIDGCYARASAMARIAEKESIHMGKVFAEGDLQIDSASEKFKSVIWDWHVTPILYVKQPDGKVQLMVFDPALFQRPVTLEYWKHAITNTSNINRSPYIRKVSFGSRFQYDKGEEYKSEWPPWDIAHMNKTMADYLAVADNSSPIVKNKEEKELGVVK